MSCRVMYTMCMHINRIIASTERMSADELDRIQETIDRRRRQLGNKPVSTVVERRDYRNGILQLERRAYRRKDGELTERGPYWYFHYREGGRQRTMYLGKTNSPEQKVEAMMEGSDD
jgi:hypothetical protein